MKNHQLKFSLAALFALAVSSSFAQWAPDNTNIYNTNSGNVGIGTSYPLGKLHVNGDIYSSGTVHAGGLDIFNLTADSLRQVKDIKLVNGLCINGTSEARIFSNTSNLFLQNDPDINYNTIINAANGGNVGIGTDNPGAKLDVNGSMRVSGLAAGSGYKLVGVDASGNMLPVGGNVQINPLSGTLQVEDNDWHLTGNTITDQDFIGTLNYMDIVIKTNNTERGRITKDGNMTLLGNMQVAGTSQAGIVQGGSGAYKTVLGQAQGQALNFGTGYLGFNAIRNQSVGTWTLNSDGLHNGGGIIWSNITGQMFFAPVANSGTTDQSISDASVSSNVAMTITPDGRVGIGTDNPPLYAKLSVKGLILAEEIKVRVFPWPDYVFTDAHTLMPLDSLKEYVNDHHHLPGVPAAGEVEAANGFNVGQMQVKQMEKIEELYLYMLELNEKLRLLEKENCELKQQLDAAK